MKTPVDFQKVREKRQRNRRIKQILVFISIILLIFLALYINDLLVRKNVPAQMGDAISSIGGDGYPVEIPSGAIKDIKNIGNNLVILKESNMYVYNKKSKQTANVQRMNEKTVVDTNKDTILQYDIGDRKACLYSASSLMHTFESDSNIISADIGDSGHVAIVTSPPNFVAEINVYTPKHNVFYTRTFSERIVSSVSVSTKGKSIAVATLGTENGVLETQVIVYPLYSEDASANINLSDRIVVKMDYIDEDTFAVLTNRDYLLYDTAGTLLSSYTFPENFVLQEFCENSNNLLILGKDSDTREYILVLLNSQGVELSSLRDDRRPLDIDFDDKNIYYLSSEGIHEYNYAFIEKDVYLYQGIERVYTIGDRVYLITENEIHLLDKSKKAEQ